MRLKTGKYYKECAINFGAYETVLSDEEKERLRQAQEAEKKRREEEARKE